MIRGGERGGRPPYPDRDRGADLILKRLAGSIAFPTSRSNTNSRIAWATKFLWVDGLGRHSAPQCGLGVRERPWTSSHAGLFEGAQLNTNGITCTPSLTALYSSSVRITG